MTRAATTDSVPGDALSAATENTKLSNCGTATQNIDAANVRDEGVDARNLGDYPAHVTMQMQDNASTSATTYQDGWTIGGAAYGADARQELTHNSGVRLDLSASPVTVQAGDLVVIEWQVLKELVTTTLRASSYCWVVQGYWDITDATLTNFETLSGNAEIGNTFSLPGQPHDESEDFSLIPHADLINLVAHNAPNYTSRGYWAYRHSGGDRLIYGITLMLSGIYGVLFSAVGSIPRFIPYPPGNPTGTIDIERCQLALQVYRK